MTGKRIRVALLLGAGAMFFAFGGSLAVATDQKPDKALPASTADHSAFEALKREFNTGPELTKACLSCHNLASKQVHASTHWRWEYTNEKTGQKLGKKNVVNGSFLAITANEPYCARCHIGQEWTDASFDFSDEEQVDCLACHDTTGTYASKKMHQLRVKCSACHLEWDKSIAREVVRKPDLSALAMKVGKPGVAVCGSCHFASDGGDGVKHGDLDSSLLKAPRELDVHMAKDGLGFSCTTCHQTARHQTAGSRYNPSGKDTKGVDVVGGSRATCESCHGLTPHPDTANVKLNDHTDRIACQTCHIPALARGGVPTKTYWDWSTAGRLNEKNKAIIEKDAKGRIIYSSQRGSAEWAENVAPGYVWLNGEVKHLTLSDKINADDVVRLNTFAGSAEDPDARIWPVKVLRGKQPIDTENSTLVAARLFGKKKDAYWKAYDWETSIHSGMKAAGHEFSGKFGFAETQMYIPVNHMVAPAENALTCEACHSRDGRMAAIAGIYMPGRGANPLVDLLGILLVAATFAGVIGHAALRKYFKLKAHRTPQS